MTYNTEHVWAIRGQPVSPSDEQWPIVVHDIHSKRLRYQHAPRYIALALGEFNGMARMTARWLPNENRWQLLDILPDMEGTACLK